MAQGIFATHWLDWRELRGQSPLQRRKMDKILETCPSLLYFGDSWFSTPLYPNLARQSIEAINGLGMIYGKPGANSKDLLGRTNKIEDLVNRIEADKFDALLISLGGNDAIDKLDSQFLDRNESLTPQQAFDRVVDSRVFEFVYERFDRLLSQLEASGKLLPEFRVIAHGYAPLLRIGVPADLTPSNIGLVGMIIKSTGPWIWGPMQHVLPDHDAARKFASLLLKTGFRDMVLTRLGSKYPNLLETVDFSSLNEMKAADQWFDEIHPNKAGFEIMARHLNKKIKRVLPIQKKHAVT